MRNKLVYLSLICVLSLAFTTSVNAALYYNNFNAGDPDLTGFVTTDVLVQGANTPPPTQWIDQSGYITLSRTAGTFPEQQVFMTNNTLNIGETLRCDVVVHSTTFNADIGLAVGATQTPPAAIYAGTNLDLRQNYFTMYLKDGSSGWGNVDFVGTTNVAGQNGYVTAQADYPNVTGLWVKHLSQGAFDIGYTSSVLGDVLFRHLTGVSWDTGSNPVIGLYADVRQVTTYGQVDNLRVVPEPATAVMALIGFLGMGLLWLRKK
jgi:hypothetical protein